MMLMLLVKHTFIVFAFVVVSNCGTSLGVETAAATATGGADSSDNETTIVANKTGDGEDDAAPRRNLSQQPNNNNENNSLLIRVIQLGDSYSSGNGSDGLNPSSSNIHWCFRHNTNWGGLAVETLRSYYSNSGSNNNNTLLRFLYSNRACSDSETRHFTEEYTLRDDERGQCYPNEEGLRIESVYEYSNWNCDGWAKLNLFASCPRRIGCRNFVRRQIDEVGKHTDLVLMTIGGNDVGFGDIVIRCFIPITGSEDACNTVLGNTRQIITDFEESPNGIYQRTKRALLSLREQLKPEAKVVLAAYPLIVMNDDTGVYISQQDIDKANEVRELGKLLTEAQRSVIQDLNSEFETNMFYFFDKTPVIFAGHEAHPGTLFLENPNSYLVEKQECVDFEDWFAGNVCTEPDVQKQIFHPNREGQIAWGTDPNHGMARFLHDQVIPRIIEDRQLQQQQRRLLLSNNNVQYQYPDSAIDLVLLVDLALPRDDLERIASRIGSYIDDVFGPITENWRIAVAQYGCTQLDTKIVQSFTDDVASIETALASLLRRPSSTASIVDPPSQCQDGSLLLSGMQNVLNNVHWFLEGGVTSTVIVLAGSEPSYSTETEVAGISGKNHDLNVQFNIVSYNDAVGPDSDAAKIAEEIGGNFFESFDNPADTLETITRWFEEKVTNPVAEFDDVGIIARGTTVSFNAEGSYDPKRGGVATYRWNMLNGTSSGSFVTRIPRMNFTYEEDYQGYAKLIVETPDGRNSSVFSRPVLVNQYGLYPGTCRFEENGRLSMNNPSECFKDKISKKKKTSKKSKISTKKKTAKKSKISTKKKTAKKPKTSKA